MTTKFTKEELTKIYDMARNEIDEGMCGDWDAVQQDLSELHSIQAKACTLRKNLLENI